VNFFKKKKTVQIILNFIQEKFFSKVKSCLLIASISGDREKMQKYISPSNANREERENGVRRRREEVTRQNGQGELLYVGHAQVEKRGTEQEQIKATESTYLLNIYLYMPGSILDGGNTSIKQTMDR
jgi:hypothetical protein